jgi:hypothetical protein
MNDSDQSRVRDPKNALVRAKSDSKVDAGVSACVELMVAGKWRTGKSHEALAKQFSVTRTCVERWASEASRHIRRALGDPEELRARWLSQLEAVHGEARELGDLPAAIAAIGVAAKVSGIDKQGASSTVVNVAEVPAVRQLVADLKEWLATKYGPEAVVEFGAWVDGRYNE